MKDSSRPLAGCVLNLSISECEESPGRGFPRWQVNRTMLQLVNAFFAQGIGVVFGHDWRDDGVMEAVHGLALRVHSPVDPGAGEENAGRPLLLNILPWPDQPRLTPDERDGLASTLRIEQAGLPAELAAQAQGPAVQMDDPPGPLYQYLRARGLTELRHRLTSIADARLCVGGRTSGSQGRYPGVIEEAFLAVRTGMPLYLSGLLGGAARQVIAACEGGEMTQEFCPPTVVQHLYSSPPIEETDPRTEADRRINRAGVWSTFREAGVAGLASTNGLSAEENLELFHTQSVDHVIRCVLLGLSRVVARSESQQI